MDYFEREEIDELFALLLESVPIGITIFDHDLRLRYMNQRHARINQMTLSDKLGKRISDFLPEAASIIEPKLQFVLHTGSPLINQEIVGERPSADGHVLHRMASYFPWRNRQGQPKGVFAIIQDSTVDHFSQKLLEAGQQRLLRVLDNLFAFVGVLELDGTLSHANKAPLEAAGIDIDDVRGKKFWQTYWFSHDIALQEQIRGNIDRCRAGEVIRCDIQVMMADQKLMWIDFMLAPLRDSDGRVTHLIPSAMDISARRANEALLKESEALAQSIVVSSDEAIITKTLQGIITAWNPAAERLLGYSADEALGKKVTMLFPPDQLDEEEKILAKIANDEQVPTFETVRLHKLGHLVDVAVTISPLRDRQGKVIGACKLARDISMQKRQRELVERSLEEKTSLLFEIHHRVKNNLQIVSSLMKMQARKASANESRSLLECEGRIRAMSLIHQLLYESDSLAGIDFSTYLKELLVLTEAVADTSQSQIQFSFCGPDEMFMLDAQRTIPLGLIVYELVLNAVKHAFIGRPTGLINVKLSAFEAGMITLTVEDDGIGLPEGFRWGGKAGLGSQLVPMFVQQLNGELSTRELRTGTSISVKVKLVY